MNLIALALLAIGGLIVTIGDLFMKEWITTNRSWIYAGGMIFYLIGMNFLAFSFKYKNIAVASVIFILINVITLIVFSYFYFHEKLSGLEIGGILLGIAAIVMLELAEK
jgi:multidrug transporter EmrE-like cation transporter